LRKVFSVIAYGVDLAMAPILQVALDYVDLHRALRAAEEAVAGGADWLEAGTPLIKSEGMKCVRELRSRFPKVPLVADLKVMDAGRIEVEAAAKAGAHHATVMGAATDSTVKECIRAGANYGIQVGVDLLAVSDPVMRAQQAQEWGAGHVGVHTAIDEQMLGGDPFDVLREIRQKVTIPIAVAGGMNSESAADAVAAGADIVIVGGAICKARDAAEATRAIKQAMATGEKRATVLFKRVTGEEIREVFSRVSTANISDGMHRTPCLEGIKPVVQGARVVGKAFTVRTYPGDWAKPVEAIDEAGEGDVIVIDAGGVAPAIWGEMATLSAIERKISGVVINGAIRDTHTVRKLGFPAFARLVTSHAGEPRGMGELNVPLLISGVRVFPGDWVVGDDDGVMIIPKGDAVELANRGMECLEKEDRIMEEIRSGKSTLAAVMDLLRWEKRYESKPE